MQNVLQRRWTRVFETNAAVEGGYFYDGRKRTVLETHDKQSHMNDFVYHVFYDGPSMTDVVCYVFYNDPFTTDVESFVN